MTIWIRFWWQQVRGSVVRTGDQTSVQTMEENRNANTFEILHEKFVCSLTLLFFYKVQCFLWRVLVTSPWPHLSIKSWPDFGSFSDKWRISKSRISNCPFSNLWSSFQPCEVTTYDIIELRQRWSASKSSSFNASISVWYLGKHLNDTHKKMVKPQNWITCALLGITKPTAFLVWKQRECYSIFEVLFMQRVLRLGSKNWDPAVLRAWCEVCLIACF